MIDFKGLRPTWMEIDLDALAYNTKLIRERIKENAKVIAVVKGDAYSHGADVVSQVFLDNGASMLAVAASQEGVFLRKSGIDAPILILGPTFPHEAETIAAYNLIPTVTSLFMLEPLDRAGEKYSKKVDVHLKVDTGMGRIGFFPEEIGDVIDRMLKYKNIRISGMFSHFSSSSDDEEYTKLQFDRFMKAKEIAEKKIHIEMYHIANSAAILLYPQMHCDGVRPGILLYGYFPGEGLEFDLPIKKTLTFKTRIGYIKEVPQGTPIGYSKTYITRRKTRIATLPVGYADGYHRFLSNKGKVIINGEFASVVGRVCMDQIMVDVTDIKDASIGDEVVLLGKQGDKEVWLTDWARLTGASVHQVLIDLDRVRPIKVYKKHDKIEKIVYPYGL